MSHLKLMCEALIAPNDLAFSIHLGTRLVFHLFWDQVAGHFKTESVTTVSVKWGGLEMKLKKGALLT